MYGGIDSLMGTEELLIAVIATLDTVEVHGKKNLDRLLGSIKALEAMRQTIESEKEKKISCSEGVKQDG